MYRIEEYSPHGDSRVVSEALRPSHYETLDMRAEDTMCRCGRVDIRRDIQVRSVVYGVPSEPKHGALLSVLSMLNEGRDIALRREQSHIQKVRRRPWGRLLPELWAMRRCENSHE